MFPKELFVVILPIESTRGEDGVGRNRGADIRLTGATRGSSIPFFKIIHSVLLKQSLMKHNTIWKAINCNIYILTVQVEKTVDKIKVL